MMANTARELKVVGYRPSNRGEVEKLTRENEHLKRVVQYERRKRMTVYERELAEQKRKKMWFKRHAGEIFGGILLWHFVELSATILGVVAILKWMTA